MARQCDRLKKRNFEIESLYVKLCKKYPHWKNDFVVEKLADKFFLSPRTVYGILSGEYSKHEQMCA